MKSYKVNISTAIPEFELEARSEEEAFDLIQERIFHYVDVGSFKIYSDQDDHINVECELIPIAGFYYD